MSNADSSPLKIWRDEADEVPIGFRHSPLLDRLCRAFEHATGWVLDRVESRERRRERLEFGLTELDATAAWRIVDLSAALAPNQRAAHRQRCDELAAAISELLRELSAARLALRSAHHELAASGLGAIRNDSIARWGEAMSRLLAMAASGSRFSSAAIYLLDSQAQQLTRRFASGLAFDDQAHQRSLTSAPADIEAMAGHAVVLTRVAEIKQWRVPCPARAAVCLPLASVSNILGTAWFVSDCRRKISNQQINLLELAAGRIAAEIEAAFARQSVAALTAGA